MTGTPKSHPHVLVHLPGHAAAGGWACDRCKCRNHQDRFKCDTCDYDECGPCAKYAFSAVANTAKRPVLFSVNARRYYCGKRATYRDQCDHCNGQCGLGQGCACIECELLNKTLGCPKYAHVSTHNHPVLFGRRYPDTSPPWTCTLCRRQYTATNNSFHCADRNCDFDMCQACSTK
ncbi:hypothetical protein HDU96_002908, partial [Phlyctochytrium bullatum]